MWCVSMKKQITRDNYQHRRHNKNLIMAHFIFVTKYRKPLLNEDIRTDVMQFIYDACVRHHWYIKRMETDKDHIHILLQYNPGDSVTKVISTLKQYSTYYIWKRHEAELRNIIGKKKRFGQTVTLQHLLGRYHRLQLNVI